MSDTNTEDMNVILKELRALVEDGDKDVVRTEQIKKMEDAFESRIKSMEDAYAAANAPGDLIKTSEDEQAVKAFAHYMREGSNAVQRSNEGKMIVKAVGDQASLSVAREGGYLLPKKFGEMIDLTNRTTSPLRSMVRVIPNAGMGYITPVKVTHGTADIRTEFGAIHSSKAPTYDTISHTFFEVNAEEMATVWVEEDSSAEIELVAALITDILQSLAEKETDQFLFGTNQNALASGGTNVNGLLAQTRLVAGVNRTTSTFGSMAGVETITAGVVVADDIMNLMLSLHGRYDVAGSILTGRDVVRSLVTQKDLNNNYILAMGDIQNGAPMRIWGKNLVVSDGFADLGDASTAPLAVFGDFQRSIVIADAAPTTFLADPYTDKRFVKHLGRRRTSSSIVNPNGLRALYNKAAAPAA